eukprot:TRINITY_DN1878_c0_g1_i1.p1 TRINITY_DN1878_c0_g1~~TRINITY_DN1878_c0_g1_i1.p1  ORF type:complete len:415 (-),score=33.71 TRINITY_DN1878_c0_g1_i1:20-1264(-)
MVLVLPGLRRSGMTSMLMNIAWIGLTFVAVINAKRTRTVQSTYGTSVDQVVGIFTGDAQMPKMFGSDSAPIKVLTFGDSLTAGWNGRAHGVFEPYGKALQAELGTRVEVVVDGISSGTASEFVNKTDWPRIDIDMGEQAKGKIVGPGLSYMLAQKRFDLVVIMAGTNDMGHNYPNEDIIQNIIQLHTFCHEAGVDTVALSIPMLQAAHRVEDRRQVNKALETWCDSVAERCKLYVESDAPGRLRQWDDGIHYHPQDYRRLGVNLSTMIGPLLGVEVRPKPLTQPLPVQRPLQSRLYRAPQHPSTMVRQPIPSQGPMPPAQQKPVAHYVVGSEHGQPVRAPIQQMPVQIRVPVTTNPTPYRHVQPVLAQPNQQIPRLVYGAPQPAAGQVRTVTGPTIYLRQPLKQHPAPQNHHPA